MHAPEPDAATDNPKVAFWTAFVVVYVVLVIATIELVNLLERFGDGGRVVAGFSFPLMILANLAAARVCRWLGVSRESTAVEVIRRGIAGPDAASPAPFTLKYPWSLWLTLACVMTAGFVACVVMACVAGATPDQRPAMFAVLAGSGAAAVGFWVMVFCGLGVIAWADDTGVRGYGRGFALWSTAVPWADIETCDVTVRTSATGITSRPLFTFKDAAGRVLLDMLTIGADEPQVRKLQAAVAAYLGAAGDKYES